MSEALQIPTNELSWGTRLTAVGAMGLTLAAGAVAGERGVASAEATAPTGAVAYFAPGTGRYDGYTSKEQSKKPTPADVVIPLSQWHSPYSECDESRADNVTPTDVKGRTVTELASWKSGWRAVTGFLNNASDPQRSNITKITIIEPGDSPRLDSDPCAADLGPTLADWLEEDKQHKLVVIAGQRSYDKAHPSVVDGRPTYWRGIREHILSDIAVAQRPQVTRCSNNTDSPNLALRAQAPRLSHKAGARQTDKNGCYSTYTGKPATVIPWQK